MLCSKRAQSHQCSAQLCLLLGGCGCTWHERLIRTGARQEQRSGPAAPACMGDSDESHSCAVDTVILFHRVFHHGRLESGVQKELFQRDLKYRTIAGHDPKRKLESLRGPAFRGGPSIATAASSCPCALCNALACRARNHRESRRDGVVGSQGRA